tara:strand:- start:3295 stop:3684 length:390 start_codon:yes stop_codon:yes gene_type:complete
MCTPVTIPAITKLVTLIAAGKTAYDTIQDQFNDPADNRAPEQPTNAPGVARKQVQQAAEVPEEDDKKEAAKLEKSDAQNTSRNRKQLGLSQLNAIISEDPKYVGLTTPPETNPSGVNIGGLYAPPTETR